MSRTDNDSARLVVPWRRADSGARADPSFAVCTVWPGRMSRIFPGRRETRRRRASLHGVVAKANIKLAVHLSSDGAGVYSSCWVPDEETEWSEPRFSYLLAV